MYSSYLRQVLFRGQPFDQEKIDHILSLDLPEQLTSLREMYKREERPLDSRAEKRSRALLRLLPRFFRPRVYVDFGGADGQITAHMARALGTRQAFCADLSEWQNMHHSETRDESVNFLALTQGDNTIPLPNASVDFCTALQVLHHVPDQQASVSELHRILRPGGYLLLREHDCTDGEVARRIDWVHYLYEIVVTEQPNWEYLEHNAKYHSMVEWIQMMQGFRLVRMDKPRDDDIHRNCHMLFQKE